MWALVVSFIGNLFLYYVQPYLELGHPSCMDTMKTTLESFLHTIRISRSHLPVCFQQGRTILGQEQYVFPTLTLQTSHMAIVQSLPWEIIITRQEGISFCGNASWLSNYHQGEWYLYHLPSLLTSIILWEMRKGRTHSPSMQQEACSGGWTTTSWQLWTIGKVWQRQKRRLRRKRTARDGVLGLVSFPHKNSTSNEYLFVLMKK